MGIVTKKTFLDSIRCPTLGWLTCNESIKKTLAISDELLLEEGLEIHERARTIFPDGKLVSGDNETAAKQTQEYIQDNEINTIYEATFLVNDYIAKADILIRELSGWHVYEVKSGINDKEEYIDDLSYTVMVANHANIEFTNCSLLLISKEYRLGMENARLFAEINHTSDAIERSKVFADCWASVLANISQSSKPEPKLKWDCKNCDIFKECTGHGVKNHIFDLPRISQKMFNKLIKENIFEVEDIPSHFRLSANQAKVRDAVINDKITVNTKELSDALNSIEFPAYYLDFETVQTAIPLYQEIAPYDQITTQFSIHVSSRLDKIEEHYEYIADPSKDCRRQLVERLINDCHNEGSIIVFTSFEKTRIKGLINLFPDLQNELEAILERIVDLNKIISDNVYHPKFHGSSSIKVVLPALVPTHNYENMDVSNGLDASATFAYLVKGKYKEEEIQEKIKQLLEYCNLDTLAMVKLHEALIGYI